jgi:hypothetical protein
MVFIFVIYLRRNSDEPIDYSAGEGLRSGAFLAGGDQYFPSLYYEGGYYSWIRMLYPDILPDGYEQIGSIIHIEDVTPYENFQLAAVFDATGEVYRNEDEPDFLLVRINTDWITDRLVVFQKLMAKRYIGVEHERQSF